MINKRYLICVVLFFLIALPLGVHYLFNPVQFNQFLLQKLEFRYGAMSASTFFDLIRSTYASGINVVSGRAITDQPKLDDELGIFSYVFSWVPPYAIVYPTEGFYYFSTKIGDQFVAGNIRIADLDKGLVSLAYFPVTAEATMSEPTYSREITEADGLGISQQSDYAYDVTWQGKTVHFKLPSTAIKPPRDLTLLPEEEFLGQIHDESGIKLFFLYNNATKAFYEVLNEEDGVTDNFDPFADHFLLGKRTGFVFYNDEEAERKILVAVNGINASANNFLDGPGDQVPFRLDFKDKLNAVYPNTYLWGGIDEHGVYPNREEWIRIAVAPFEITENPTSVVSRLDTCTDKQNQGVFYTCLTKEWWNTPEWRQSVFDKLRDEDSKQIVCTDLGQCTVTDWRFFLV